MNYHAPALTALSVASPLRQRELWRTTLDAHIAIERGMLQIAEALIPQMPDIVQAQTLVADVMSQYNAVVIEVQKQARTPH